MSQHWTSVCLKEIVHPVLRGETPTPGKTYRQIGVKLWGEGAYEREAIDGSQTKYSQLFRADAGDLIVNKIWARNGSVAVVTDQLSGAYGSSEFPMFEPIRDRVNPRWLHWLTKTPEFWTQCDEKSRGTSGKNRIRPEKFLEITVPLPTLDEQRRIVARIEGLDAQIHEAHTLRHQAADEAEVLVANHIKGLFDAGQNSGWRVGRLGDYVVDDCYGSSEKTHDDSSGTPVLRMGNIQNGQLDTHDLKYLHIAEKNRAKLVLKRGDILVNRTNSAELVGKCAVFDLEHDFAFASYLIRLRLDTERAEPRLVALFINSPAGRAYMFNERKQMTGQANVNATKLKALPIALPPLPEQRQILTELDTLQAKVSVLKLLQAETTTELDALLPSVLDCAFRRGL